MRSSASYTYSVEPTVAEPVSRSYTRPWAAPTAAAGDDGGVAGAAPKGDGGGRGRREQLPALQRVPLQRAGLRVHEQRSRGAAAAGRPVGRVPAQLGALGQRHALQGAAVGGVGGGEEGGLG